VNEFLPKRDVSSIGIYKTLKGNLLHVESEAEKGQIEVDIDIQKMAPKFNGQSRRIKVGMSANANCMMPHRGSFANYRVENGRVWLNSG
jgi:hypothetical protein